MEIMEINESDLVILAGIPLKDYPKKPPDLPDAFLMECPICKKSMWFTEKKLEMEKQSIQKGYNYMLSCWKCIEKEVGVNKKLLEKVEVIKI